MPISFFVKLRLLRYKVSPYHSELEWNFCVRFSWEGLQVTHMVFAYHWTSKVSRTSEKIKKAKKIFKGHTKATDTFHRNFMTLWP